MLTHKNQLTVPEVSCYSRQEVEGGVIIRYLIRSPGEVEWRPVKVFRAADASGGKDLPPDQPERVIGADAAMEDAPS